MTAIDWTARPHLIEDEEPRGFGELLQHHIRQRGVSRNWLAHQAGVDASYLTRICLGGRGAPRLHIVQALARALSLSVAARDQFFVAAGYAPPSVCRLGEWPAACQAVCEVLGDFRLTVDDRDRFAAVIYEIAHRWRRPVDG